MKCPRAAQCRAADWAIARSTARAILHNRDDTPASALRRPPRCIGTPLAGRASEMNNTLELDSYC
jgi:hypothetical protein